MITESYDMGWTWRLFRSLQKYLKVSRVREAGFTYLPAEGTNQ